MAVCGRCHKSISAPDSKRQHVEKDANGRIVAVLHHKCWHIQKRRNWVGDPSGKYYQDSPDAYQMEALRKRQQELAEDRAKEEAPKGFSDWRDPDTMEL